MTVDAEFLQRLRERLPAWTQEEGKVAIVHDWVTGMRGGEAILDAICTLFPKADLVTLLQTDFKMSRAILNGRRVRTSFLQHLMKLPRFAGGYRKLLPLFPAAIESIDMSGYRLVLSNTHCVAKGVRKEPGALHVAYVSTPMRYVWDMFEEYFGDGKAGAAVRLAARAVRGRLRKWDVESTKGVDYLIANSRFVRWRIQEFWKRDARVIHPFFDTTKFEDRFDEPKNYYLMVSAMAPYKKIDLAIKAFRGKPWELRIVGKGQDEQKLRALAEGMPNVEFLGGLSDEALGELYRKAKAFIFPGLEDFGITPLEAMYNGRPVIAYGKGGLLDTVTEKTGIFFEEQSAKGLARAVEKFERTADAFSPHDCRARAMEFTRENFLREYTDALERAFAGERT